MPPWRKPSAWSQSNAATIRGSSRWSLSAAPGTARLRIGCGSGIPRVDGARAPGRALRLRHSGQRRSEGLFAHGALACRRKNFQSSASNASLPGCGAGPKQIFRSERWNGAIRHKLSVDVRYQGQGYELNVPYSRSLIRDFCHEHQRRYGYTYPAREVELVTLRLRSTIKSQAASTAQGSNPGQVGTGSGTRARRAKPSTAYLQAESLCRSTEKGWPRQSCFGSSFYRERNIPAPR